MMSSIDSNVSYPTFNKDERKVVSKIESRMKNNITPLTDKELEGLGKKLCGRAERIKRMFTGFGTRGSKNITKKEFLREKAYTVIKNMNIKKIMDHFNGEIEKDELNYVLKHLSQNEVISSGHAQDLKSLHESFKFYQKAKEDELHWLKDFKDQLGDDLKDLNPFAEKTTLSSDEKIADFERFSIAIQYLDDLNTKYQIEKKDFSELLKYICNNKNLKEIDFEDLALFTEILNLYTQVKQVSEDKTLENTKKLFVRLKIIEGDDSATAESNEKLRSFLSAHPRVTNLLMSLEFEANSELINVVNTIQTYFEKTNSFPERFSEAKSCSEVLKIYQEAIEDAIDEGVIKRELLQVEDLEVKPQQTVGLSEKKFGVVLSKIPSRLITDSVKADFKKLQKDFESSGQAELFIKLVDEYFKGAKFKTPKDVESKLNDFKNDKHPLNIYVTHKVAEKTREYLNLGILLQELKKFQDEVVNYVVKAKGTDKLATKKERMKKIDEHFDKEVSKFNKAQLEVTRENTRKKYGDQVAEEFYNGLNEDVRSGKVHYLTVETTLSKREAVSQLFVKFNITHIQEQFGNEVANQAKNYLTHPDNQEAISSPSFEEAWKTNVKGLSTTKKTWLEQENISEEAFKDYLSKFIAENNGLILDSMQIKNFESFMRRDILKKLVLSFEKSHGASFANAVRDYLETLEPEILSGEKSIAESALFGKEVTLEEQISLLIPFFIKNFEKYRVLDHEFVFEVLSEGVDMTPEKLKVRLKNLERLATVIVPEKSLKNDQEVNFARELVKQVAKPYLMDFDLDNSEILSSKDKSLAKQKEQLLKKEAHLRESVGNIIKFCTNKYEQRQIYSPQVLAKAVKDELDGSAFIDYPSNASTQRRFDIFAGHTTDIRPKKINDGLNQKCMKFFIEEAVKERCGEKIPYENMIKFTRALQERINATAEHGMTTTKSRDYLLEIIDLATTLPLNQSAKLSEFFRAIDTLDMKVINQRANHRNLRNLKKQKEPSYLFSDVKANIIDKVTAARSTNMHPAVEILQDNSFGAIREFIPRLLTHFVSEKKDKDRVRELESSISKLAPFYYESDYVKFGLEAGIPALSAFITTSEFISDKAKIAEKGDQTSVKALVLENLNKIKGFDLSLLQGKTRAESQEILKQKDHDLELFEKVSTGLFDKLKKVRENMYDPEAVKIGKDGKPEVSTLKSLINDDLPKILKDRGLIEKVLKNSVKYLSYISGKGGFFIVKKILNLYLSSQMKKIDALDLPTRKLILEVINTGITAGMLAGPGLLDKHDISKYFDFLQGFVDFMQTPPDQMTDQKLDKFYFDIVSVLKQGISEVANYGEILDQTIDETFAVLNPQQE